MKRIIVLLILLATALWVSPKDGMDQDIRMEVTRVIDGDTFEGYVLSRGERTVSARVRVSGIDAPERGQFYGDVATLHLEWLIEGKMVALSVTGRDMYGRMIATVRLNGFDIAEEMLRQGLAWHFREYDHNLRYAQLESEARENGRGLWADERAVAPWRWRQMSKFERNAFR